MFPSLNQTGTSTWPRRLLRSEEHTSELQSHLNLVCRLLLEKKKNTPNTSHSSTVVWATNPTERRNHHRPRHHRRNVRPVAIHVPSSATRHPGPIRHLHLSRC